MIQCPRCQAPVRRRQEGGVHLVTCPSCEAKFRLVTGKLTGIDSRPLSGSGALAERATAVDTLHEMRLALPNGGVLAAPFRARGAGAHVRLARAGDDVTFVHAALPGPTGDTSAEPIVQIVDHTTAQVYPLDPPRHDFGRLRAALLPVTLLLGGLTVIGFADRDQGWQVLMFFFAALFTVSRLISLVDRRFPNVPRLSTAEADRLLPAHELVARLRELQDGRDTARRAIAEQEAVLLTLRGLREKMERVGRETYARRLDTLARAMELLSSQRAIQQKLLAEYERALAIVEIEIESGAVADALSADIADEITAQRAELDALREQGAELERLVAANDEVARLLRPGGAA